MWPRKLRWVRLHLRQPRGISSRLQSLCQRNAENGSLGWDCCQRNSFNRKNNDDDDNYDDNSDDEYAISKERGIWAGLFERVRRARKMRGPVWSWRDRLKDTIFFVIMDHEYVLQSFAMQTAKKCASATPASCPGAPLLAPRDLERPFFATCSFLPFTV